MFIRGGETTDYIVDFASKTLFVEARGGERLGKSQKVDVGFNANTMLYYEKSGSQAVFSASNSFLGAEAGS